LYSRTSGRGRDATIVAGFSVIYCYQALSLIDSASPKNGILSVIGIYSDVTTLWVAGYFLVSRKFDIASRKRSSKRFHFHRSACSDSAESATMGCNSSGASSQWHRCIRMCVASLNMFDSPDNALRTALVASTSRASSLGIGAFTPISRNAESISPGRMSVAVSRRPRSTSPAILVTPSHRNRAPTPVRRCQVTAST
jgi:hypothetical protein